VYCLGRVRIKYRDARMMSQVRVYDIRYTI
jgi:hypothetical protein